MQQIVTANTQQKGFVDTPFLLKTGAIQPTVYAGFRSCDPPLKMLHTNGETDLSLMGGCPASSQTEHGTCPLLGLAVDKLSGTESDRGVTVRALLHGAAVHVTFALRRPEHFTVMFDAPISKRKHPDSAAAAEQAFGALMSFVKGCQDAGRLPLGDLRQMALLAWTMVHGIAKLAITGRLPFPSNAEILKFAEFVIDQSLPVSR